MTFTRKGELKQQGFFVFIKSRFDSLTSESIEYKHESLAWLLALRH